MPPWLRHRLFKLVLWISDRFASRPKREKVFEGLDKLLHGIREGKESKGVAVPFCTTDRFIIFSDQHKGSGNGADDFALCGSNYTQALAHYFRNGYRLVVLGDAEELWENRLSAVLKHQAESFDHYRRFAAEGRFYKTIGNHDLDWKNDPWTITQVKRIFGTDLTIHDGVLLQTTINQKPLSILCTHGHQGDGAADGNWFSKFFVSKIWAPLQSWLRINPNTPAYDAQLKTLHNRLMYEWSAAQPGLLLVTGHTHQPVFESLTHMERLCRQLLLAEAAGDKDLAATTRAEIEKRKFEYGNISKDFLKMLPTYYNAGCCCYNDGDITGIEIEDGCLRLVKWRCKGTDTQRTVLEEEKLEALLEAANTVVPLAEAP